MPLYRARCACLTPLSLACHPQLFEGIIGDLFPGVEKPDIDYVALMNSLIATCSQKDVNLQPVDSFLEKCIQLFETQIVRHGVMLVGPTGGGKSSAIDVLRASLTRLAGTADHFEKTVVSTLNPKAVTQGA